MAAITFLIVATAILVTMGLAGALQIYSELMFE
jgi:hypothetical protein